ncbi:MAG: ATP-binding protein [Bacteroidaceae bacterium]|nr:ATP-binding protein [Bacteroidaceae bacterium]
MDGIINFINGELLDLRNMTPEEIAEHDAEIERMEHQQAAREKIERYQKSGVPERYFNESLDTYKINNDMQATAAKAATNFLHAVKCGEFKSLVMIGSAGTGKTHLACAIVRETGGKYRTAPDIVEELRRAKSFTAAETEAEIIEHYGHISLLVIDEIGRGIAATDEKYMLYQILNARYNTRKPTVLISNFKKSEFLQYIGAAAADRLVESAEVWELNGESYRRELRAANG